MLGLCDRIIILGTFCSSKKLGSGVRNWRDFSLFINPLWLKLLQVKEVEYASKMPSSFMIKLILCSENSWSKAKKKKNQACFQFFILLIEKQKCANLLSKE